MSHIIVASCLFGTGLVQSSARTGKRTSGPSDAYLPEPLASFSV